MQIDLFFIVFLAVLLAYILAGIIHNNIMSFRFSMRRRLRPVPIADKDFENLNIPPSNEVLESELDKQAEIMARAMKILNKQIRDKTGGEIDLENPPGE